MVKAMSRRVTVSVYRTKVPQDELTSAKEATRAVTARKQLDGTAQREQARSLVQVIE